MVLDTKRKVLVILSALGDNRLLYDYGLRLARRGFTLLLVDYSLEWPGGLAQDDRQPAATLWDVLAGNADVAEAIVTHRACRSFHMLYGMTNPPPFDPYPIGRFVIGYDIVLVIAPMEQQFIDEWIPVAAQTYFACSPEAGADESLLDNLAQLRRLLDIRPRLLVECAEWDDQVGELSRRLGLEVEEVLGEGSAYQARDRLSSLIQRDRRDREEVARVASVAPVQTHVAELARDAEPAPGEMTEIRRLLDLKEEFRKVTERIEEEERRLAEVQGRLELMRQGLSEKSAALNRQKEVVRRLLDL